MDDLMLLENPMYGMNPRRRRHTRRNPVSTSVSKYTQGVGLTDIAGAVVGVAGATMIPNLVIAAPTDMTQKLLKVGISAAAAVGIGMGAKAMLGNEVGKAAMIGGLAGTTVVLIQTLTGFKLVNPDPLPLPPKPKSLGRSYNADFEEVKNL